jgi:predicted adenylyl cyclase CyaB
MQRVNIEIKAKCQDRIRSILKSKNAGFKGLDHQVDTYFKVSSGRLKLREGNIENHLIFYDRATQEGPKQSDVMLFDTEPNSEIKGVLTRALGIFFVVDRSREIYFIENVKFHLDVVEGLGTFMEIEAIDTGGIPKEKLMGQCKSYMGMFGIKDSDLLAVSYSDLLLDKSKT